MKDEWKPYPPQKYQFVTERLIHFNSKVVNSKAKLVGIRLTEDAKLNLPYVSLRTLLGSDCSLPLDYTEGGVEYSPVAKQAYKIISSASESKDASVDEKETVIEAFKTAKASFYRIGTDYVDHRLRQLLIPNNDAPGGYVSMTPITASSICSLLFDREQGLVPLHNKAAVEEPEGQRRKLRQAQFGIGGSKSQNIGISVDDMRRPLKVEVPKVSAATRKAYALYYQGLPIDVRAPGPFGEAVHLYVAFREQVLKLEDDESTIVITIRERELEKELVAAIARAVLDMAVEAQELLAQHAHLLPKEEFLPHLNPPRHARVSPQVRPLEIRGLLDPSLRGLCDNWARSMARLVVSSMLMPHEGTGQRLLRLDSSARFSLEAIMEGVFR